MNSISVIIIAKNEAENIVDCIMSAKQVSKDIIVADSGSQDNTQALVIKAGARLLQTDWKGYGQTRNEAAAIAVNNWVLALDADERITPRLAAAITNLSLDDDCILYGFKRSNFLAAKKLRFGEWGKDKVYRLYNKQKSAWDLLLVHETLIGSGVYKNLIPGELLHYTMKDLAEYQAKTILYARLTAEKYAAQGKKATLLKRFISPTFSFVQNYIFHLGFLDGKEGCITAYTDSKYIFLKYKLLHELLQQKK